MIHNENSEIIWELRLKAIADGRVDLAAWSDACSQFVGDPEDMFTSPKQKVDPGHAALLVIDVQNDFLAPDGGMEREGLAISLCREMIPRLASFIDAARRFNALVIFIRNVYSTDQNWYLSEVFLEQAHRRRRGSYTERPVCKKDTWGCQFYDGIRPLPQEPVVTKHRLSAFQDTDLDLILRAKKIKTLLMTGVTTNSCVETTARMGFVKDYYIVVVGDCCATYSKRVHDFTLENMDLIFGQVVDAEDVIGCWKEGSR